MTSLESRFAEALSACGIRRGQPLLAGFSGGLDSTALVVLLELTGCDFVAVHLHHGLRGRAADADAEWCREFCRHRSIVFACHDLAVAAHRRDRESLEAAARRCRLEFWKSRAPCGTAVVLGHHADDALEDLLLRLARGSNASGLTGLRARREIRGVEIVRPLLEFRRAELAAFLADAGIVGWRHDSSNDDTGFRRNAVRHQWLPMIRETLGNDLALRRSLEALRQDADFLEAAAAAALPETGKICEFRNLPPALVPRVLRLWIERESGEAWLPRHQAVARFAETLHRETSGRREIPLGDGIVLIIHNGVITVENPPVEYRIDWLWREHPILRIPRTDLVLAATVIPAGQVSEGKLRSPLCDTVYFPAGGLPATLTVCSWRPGMRMIPFGHCSDRKLKDLFSAVGIGRGRRPHHPVVCAGNETLWLAGLRRAALYPLPFGSDQPCLELRLASYRPAGEFQAFRLPDGMN